MRELGPVALPRAAGGYTEQEPQGASRPFLLPTTNPGDWTAAGWPDIGLRDRVHYDSPPLLVNTAVPTTSGCVSVRHHEAQALRAVEIHVS